jgi:hypothetical protein
MVWCLFGCGLDDDDMLALGGLFLATCGGLSWHVMVYIVAIGLVRNYTYFYHF